MIIIGASKESSTSTRSAAWVTRGSTTSLSCSAKPLRLIKTLLYGGGPCDSRNRTENGKRATRAWHEEPARANSGCDHGRGPEQAFYVGDKAVARLDAEFAEVDEQRVAAWAHELEVDPGAAGVGVQYVFQLGRERRGDPVLPQGDDQRRLRRGGDVKRGHVLREDAEVAVTLIEPAGNRGDQARNPDVTFGSARGQQLGDRNVPVALQDLLRAVQRMARHVEAKHLAFLAQQELPRPLLLTELEVQPNLAARAGTVRICGAEQVELPDCLLAFHGQHGIHCLVLDHAQGPAGMTERVESPGLDQRLHHALVARGDLRLAEKVGERGVAPLCPAGRGDRGDHGGADVAYGAEPEADVGSDRGEPQV